MPEPSFNALLASSLGVLERRVPQRYQALVEAVGGLSVRLELGDGPVGLRRRGPRLALGPARGDEAVELRGRRTVVLALLDAELTLEEAVESEALLLRGQVEDLLAFHDALLRYLDAAVRCPELEPSLEAYRRG